MLGSVIPTWSGQYINYNAQLPLEQNKYRKRSNITLIAAIKLTNGELIDETLNKVKNWLFTKQLPHNINK